MKDVPTSFYLAVYYVCSETVVEHQLQSNRITTSFSQCNCLPRHIYIYRNWLPLHVYVILLGAKTVWSLDFRFRFRLPPAVSFLSTFRFVVVCDRSALLLLRFILIIFVCMMHFFWLVVFVCAAIVGTARGYTQPSATPFIHLRLYSIHIFAMNEMSKANDDRKPKKNDNIERTSFILSHRIRVCSLLCGEFRCEPYVPLYCWIWAGTPYFPIISIIILGTSCERVVCFSRPQLCLRWWHMQCGLPTHYRRIALTKIPCRWSSLVLLSVCNPVDDLHVRPKRFDEKLWSTCPSKHSEGEHHWWYFFCVVKWLMIPIEESGNILKKSVHWALIICWNIQIDISNEMLSDALPSANGCSTLHCICVYRHHRNVTHPYAIMHCAQHTFFWYSFSPFEEQKTALIELN